MRIPSRPSRPAPAATASPRRTGLALALGLITLLALGFVAWSWHQSHRPGAVYWQAGLDYATAHQDAQAEQEWRQGIQEDPAFPDNFTQLGDLYLRQQRFPEAAAQYQTAAKLTPRDGTLFLRLNQAELGAHQTQAALDAIKRASELRPDDPDAAGIYGLQAAKMGNRPAALTALRRAHALRPGDQDYLLELARQEMDGLDMTGAERDLAQLLQTDPNNGEANRLMALLYKQKPPTPENMQKALDLAGRARRSLPDSPDVYLLLGQLQLTAGQTAQALKAFQQAQALNPNAAEILSGLVTCYTRLHQPVKAAQTAAVLQTITQRRDRIEHLNTLLVSNSADTTARLERAQLEEESSNLAAAANDYTEAARQAPGEAQVKAALSAFYQRHRTGKP